MKPRILFLFIGSIISMLGIIFHFQGKSMIGPESSFMYANPDWVLHGIEILVIGIMLIGVGLMLIFIQKKKSFKNTN